MEKQSGSTSTAPSAPPLTAPPSYEEAIANARGPPINTPPYPVGPTPMPMPAPHNQTTSLPPNYAPANPPYRPEPPSGYAPPPQASTTNPTEVRVIHQHVSYILGPNPVKMSCPNCHADIKTTTISDHQPSAHICCIVLCLLGCCLCSCLPYCMGAFMSVHHFCPNCKSYIGTWKG